MRRIVSTARRTGKPISGARGAALSPDRAVDLVAEPLSLGRQAPGSAAGHAPRGPGDCCRVEYIVHADLLPGQAEVTGQHNALRSQQLVAPRSAGPGRLAVGQRPARQLGETELRMDLDDRA